MKTSKRMLHKGSEEKGLGQYNKKEMKSEIYKKQDNKCNIWLEKNLAQRKTLASMSMIELLIEAKA